MAKFLLVITCSLFLTSDCINKSENIKELAYSVLNEIIQKDSIFARIVCGKFAQLTIPEDIIQEFFKKDKSYIEEQIRNSATLTIDTGKIYFYWKRKNRLEKTFIDTTCSKNIFYHFTYPIFSKDLQTVVVGITEDCNCMLGGWGFKAVYKKQNGKWKLVKRFDSWIS
ncbi:MAG: hypothetical protein ABUT20_24670 [Bacteroidota bacterium]